MIRQILAAAGIVPTLGWAAPINPADYKAPIRVACVGDSITQGSGTKGKPELVPDRVHPNADGALVMAHTAHSALTGQPAPKPAK